MIVTVVIPTYRREEQATRILSQLLCQDFPKSDYEIILVDQTGYSGSQFNQLVANKTVSVKHLTLHFPSIARAWNVGIQAALGEIVVFLDDDVFINSNFVRNHCLIYSEFSNVVGVAGQVLAANEKPRTKKHWISSVSKIGWCFFPLSYANQEYIDSARGCNFSFRKEAAINAGGIDENYQKTSHCFEPEFCFRLRKYGRVLFDPRPQVVHEACSSGGIRSVKIDERLQSDIEGILYFMIKHMPFYWWPLYIVSELRRDIFKQYSLISFKFQSIFWHAVKSTAVKMLSGPKYYFGQSL